MLRVFTHDLLSQRHSDLFSAVVPPQSISMRCAEPKLRQAIVLGSATYLGWIVVGDEVNIIVDPFKKNTVGEFLKEYPNTIRWRVCGYDTNSKLTLKPRILAAEGLQNPSDAVKEIVEGKGWRVAINTLASTKPTIVRRDALGRPRRTSRSGLPTSWTIE